MVAGGSYFMAGKNTLGGKKLYDGFASVGGQGTQTAAHDTQGGDGGIAGKGGIISVSQNVLINAFNGNKYTDGTDYENGKSQLEIFSQKGELRDVYKYSLFFEKREERSKDYFRKIFGETVSKELDTFIEINEYPVKNYLVRPATTCELSGYTNPITGNTQGIGSRSRLY